jgi:hypothetical protein
MAGRGYLTPVGSFFVRNHAPTPSIDLASWTLRVEGPGVDCSGRHRRGVGAVELRGDVEAGGHEIRDRATDGAGNVQPDEAGWNDLGYLYDGVVGHPVEVL